MPEHYPWLILNSPYGSAGIQVCFILSIMAESVSLFFQRMHNCCFLSQILFALLKKFCSIKFIGTNLNKVIFSMFNWKSPKLYTCHGFTKTETGKKDYSYFFNIFFPLLEKEIKQSHFGI